MVCQAQQERRPNPEKKLERQLQQAGAHHDQADEAERIGESHIKILRRIPALPQDAQRVRRESWTRAG